MNRPRLLDLFCGAGGAAMGYHRAGFDVTGVDINPQPRYPFEFIERDAIEVLTWSVYHAEAGLSDFDAIHASPPCQDYSRNMRGLVGQGHPRMIDPVRRLLQASGRPWVIENVEGSPLPSQSTLDGAHGLTLCGTMFDLPVWWHRLFETWVPIAPPRGCNHTLRPMNPHRGNRPGGRTGEREWAEARGVAWMSRMESRQAIPPAYTEYIGRQLLEHLKGRAA